MINLSTCNACDLSSNPVNGMYLGNKQKSVCVILEKPHYTDDLLSRPLEETQGIYLKKLLKESGLNFYVTHLIKCYNKDIKINKKHYQVCYDTWLNKEIKDFKHIIIFGKNVADFFGILKKNEKIEDVYGKKIEKNGIMYWVWYGESYLFNRGKKIESLTKQLLKEIKHDMEILDLGKKEEHQ